MTPPPALFISHGAPSIVYEDGAAHRFLRGFGAEQLGAPSAIIVVSAHNMARGALVSTAERPETIYDFAGFGPESHKLTYPAPGAPALAQRVIEAVRAAGLSSAPTPDLGFDHGAWAPLSLMFPKADIPVLQVSIHPYETPQWHLRLGRALAQFRTEGALVIGSGAATHNLRALMASGHGHDAPPVEWAKAFSDWLSQAVLERRWRDVEAAMEIAPHGRKNHPTPDHLLPLYAAIGAAGADPYGVRLHHSFTYGVLAMDMYAFAQTPQGLTFP